MKYIYPRQVLYLHKQIIAATGGTAGVRDRTLVDSAVYRPQATFGGKDLYPDIFIKAAVLGYSLISNHPFADGNKRVGYEAMRLLLRLNGYDIKAPLEEKYDMVMKIASGRIKEQVIAQWLKTHSKILKDK